MPVDAPPSPPLQEERRSSLSPEKARQISEHKQKRGASCVVPMAIKLVTLAGADHYDVVNASTPAWGRILDEMNSMAPSLSDIPQLDTLLALEQAVAGAVLSQSYEAAPCPDNGEGSLAENGEDVSAESPMLSRVMSTAASGSSTPIRSVPERWVQDLHNDDVDYGHVPYVGDSDESSTESDADDQFDVGNKSTSKRPMEANRRRTDSHNVDDTKEDGCAGGAPAASSSNGNPEAEIFFFPTPKSDRPRRHHSFTFRFGRQER